MLAAQAGRLARERAPLRGHPQAVRGLRQARASRPSSRAIRPRAATRAASPTSPSALAKVVDRETTGPYAARVVHRATTCASSSTRPAARLRQDRRAREGAGQGQEALRRAARARAPALRLRRAHRSRPTCSRASCARSRRGGAARAPRRARRASSPQRRAELDGAWDAVLQPPTSRRCSSSGDFAAHRGHRAARRTSICAARCGALLDDEEVTCLKVRRGSLTQPGVRRDPLARLAHVPLPVADPLGQGAQPRRRSSPARTTSASTAPATRTACAPRRSRSSRR